MYAGGAHDFQRGHDKVTSDLHKRTRRDNFDVGPAELASISERELWKLGKVEAGVGSEGGASVAQVDTVESRHIERRISRTDHTLPGDGVAHRPPRSRRRVHIGLDGPNRVKVGRIKEPADSVLSGVRAAIGPALDPPQ